MPILKCTCPHRCPKCGRKRSRDEYGHYCKTKGCQYALGYPGCVYGERKIVGKSQ